MVLSGLCAGAEINTFFAPASIWAEAASLEVNIPVHSKTISISSCCHGKSAGFLSEKYLIEDSSIFISLFSVFISLLIDP